MTNAIDSLGLNNLRIIRGESVFMSAGEADSPTGYSLYIALNYHNGHQHAGGLLELQLTSLRGEPKNWQNRVAFSVSLSFISFHFITHKNILKTS